MTKLTDALTEVGRGWKPGECRLQIIQSGATIWPRSCPSCKFGPCNKTELLETKLNAQLEFFVDALKVKLLRAQEAGRTGWDAKDWKDECIEGLLRHVRKGDPLDVAAYSFFCYYNGWPTWPENES